MKPLLLSILLSIGALANTTELILTCSDNNIPTIVPGAHSCHQP